jgi:NAD(P)-dependent dehydrogenase (short-subunit alcohol dehydrogenase family)
MDLKDKVALVTGASRGIGKAIALELASRGATVVGTATTEAGAQAVTAMLAPHGGRGVVLNVTDVPACDALVDTLTKQPGGLHILVNNAGVNLPKRYLHQLTPDAIRSLVDGNLTAPFFTSVAVLPGMRKRGGGHIIQIASMAGKNISFLSGPGYTAAKHGFVALSQSINQENGIHNIRSCCICPGEVATDILKNRPEPVPQEDIERLLQPEDLAAMALFVATMPARANITEMLVTPTYMRLLAPQAKKVAAM